MVLAKRAAVRHRWLVVVSYFYKLGSLDASVQEGAFAGSRLWNLHFNLMHPLRRLFLRGFSDGLFRLCHDTATDWKASLKPHLVVYILFQNWNRLGTHFKGLGRD